MPTDRMGPRPELPTGQARGLKAHADAHDCIMVRIRTDYDTDPMQWATNSGKSASPALSCGSDQWITLRIFLVQRPTSGGLRHFVRLVRAESFDLGATSLAPGSKKCQAHARRRERARLLDLLARLKARAEQRIAAPVKVVAIHEVGLDGFWIIACSRPTALRATSSIGLGALRAWRNRRTSDTARTCLHAASAVALRHRTVARGARHGIAQDRRRGSQCRWPRASDESRNHRARLRGSPPL